MKLKKIIIGFVVVLSFFVATNKEVYSAVNESLFVNQTPDSFHNSDGASVNYELGMRFTTSVAGQITAIRYWKDSSETGTHTGRIWSSSGKQLASVVFTGETSSGWQQQNLATPLSVTANTMYTVTVNTGNTYYVFTLNGLQNSISNGNLISVAGTNGVFGNVGAYPTQSWNSSNYFRDVVFVANDTSSGGTSPSDTTAPSVPSGLTATAVSTSGINLTWTASTDATGVTGYKVYRGGTQIGTATTNSYSDTGLSAGTTYSYTVSAYDAAGNNSAQSSSANATTQTITSGGGNTISCSGNITTALQNAINSAVDGDTINIGAGSCTGGTVSWTNKNISVIGQGIGVTNVTGLSFDVTDTTKAGFRISGMSVGAAPSWTINAVDRKTGIKGWRIDHVAWSYPSCGQNIAIWINGINWGVIDHSVFNNAGNAIFIRAWAENTDEVSPWPPSGKPGMGGYSWLLPLNLGTDEAVYVEDNTFTMNTGCYMGIGDMYYGGRMVFRYNSVTNAYWQNHAARSYERGGNIKAEIYNNDFNATDPAWYRAVHIRSGTGVVFNNTLRGYFNTMNVDNQRSNGQNTDTPFGACNGSSIWDGNTPGQSGWPCLDQIGRSSGAAYPSQTSVPLYIWNNGSSSGCSTGGSCNNSVTMTSDGDSHVQAGRDYINNGTTPKSGYTPYVYPHPLVSGATPPPVTPTDTTAPTLSSVSSSSITLSSAIISWITNENSNTQVEYGLTTSYGASSALNSSMSTSHSVSLTGLNSSTLYHYRVKSSDSSGNQAVSGDYTFTTSSPSDTTAPSVPSGLTATAVSTSGINLTWTASTDATGVTGYKVYRGGTQIGTATTNSYSDTGLSAGTTYSYTVSAYDAAGNNSAQSSSASATTQTVVTGATGTANLWVDTNGGTCTRSASLSSYNDASACSSMQAAQNAALAGDKIIIKNGTYGSQSLSSGAKSSMVYFNAETDGQVLVSSLSISIDKVTVKGVIASGTGNNRGSLYLTSTGTGTVVDGFQARRIWISGDHITVQNGEFCNGSGSSSQEEDCVQVWNSSSYITFKNNVFHDWHSQYDVTYHNDFIQFYPSGTNITLDGNKFYNGPTSNIMTGGGALTNWTIQNNYFGSVNYAGNSIVFGNSSSPCSGLTFRNNVDDSGLGINNVDCSALNPNISGNIYPQTNYGLLYGSVSGGYNIFPVSGGSTFGTNAKRCTPTWLNGAPSASNGYDIRLSPLDTCAKDYVPAGSGATTDMYGTSRPQGALTDAGAYEYPSGSSSPSDTTAPSVPSGLTATAVSTSGINLSWTASTDATGVTGYKVYRGGTQIGTATTNSYSDTGLSAGTTYSYTVSAYDAAGNNSAQSSSASATTQSNIVSSTKFTSGQRVQTTANVNVRSTASASGTLLGTQSSGSLGTIVSGGQSADGYYWWNVNYDTGVDGYSAEDYLTEYTVVSDTTAPSVPSGLTATAVSTSGINLTWTASTDATGVTGYKVYRGGTQIGTATTNSYSDTGLSAGTTYSYTVSAYDAAGNNSAQSSSASATTGVVNSVGDIGSVLQVAGRTTNWSYTGVPSGIPNRTTVCATLNPGATASSINSAINACNNGVVFLNAGTYNVTGIQLYKSNVTLRGAGADKTILSGGNVINIGNGYNATNGTAITGGGTRGSNSFTVASVSGLSVGLMIELDRLDDSSFVASHDAGRSLTQVNVITGINGNNITVRNPLFFDFSSGSPKIKFTFPSVTKNSGLEDLKLEHNNTNGNSNIQYCDGCWMKGIESSRSVGYHFTILGTVNLEIRDSYIHDGGSGPNNSGINFYGNSLYGANSSAKVENNIFNKNFPSIEINNSSSGLYIGYNYVHGSVDWGGGSYLVTWTFDDGHAPFNAYNLFEGNIGEMWGMDGYFGGAGQGTLMRNYFTGYNPNGTGAKGDSIQIKRFGYYYNFVGNVLGSTNQNPTSYENGCGGPVIYQLGYPNIGNCDTVPYDNYNVSGGYPDQKVKSTLVRWGNYDYFNKASRFASSEIPVGVSVPSSQVIPVSFVYSSKPVWFTASTPWPLIGPDVNGGTGDSSGHVYKSPAQLCWESRNLVGNGTFNASLCYYGGSSPSDTTAPSVPSGLTATAVSTSGINLTWTASTDATGVTGYKVYRGGTQIGTATTNSYSDTGLSAGTTYSYTVSAYDAAGNNSAQSSSASATTQSNIVLPTISNLVGSNTTDTTQVISWNTNVATNGQVFYGLSTTYNNSSSIVDNVTNTTAHSVTLTNLSPNTTYHFKVTSVDVLGNSVSSLDFTFTTSATVVVDTTSPIISSITESNITTSGATVTWSTNENSDTQVQYGTTISYGKSSTRNTSLVTNHSVSLTGLSSGTLYHYRVKSRDASGNLAQSSDQTFTTATPPDITAPTISSIQTSNVTSNSATVTWSTNENSDTQVEYGITSSYGISSTLNTSPIKSHSVSLTGLSSGTLYHYRVKSRDASGNLAQSSDQTFTTSTVALPTDTTAPIISSAQAANITNSSADIIWVTNEGASSQVKYGKTPSYGLATSPDSTLVTSHVVSLSKLSRRTTYHIQIVSTDASGNTKVSSDSTFTTAARLGRTPKVTNLTAANGSVILSWSSPVDDDNNQYELWSGTLIMRSTNGFIETPNVATALVNLSNKETSYRDTDVVAGTTYYYSVFSYDDTGAYSDPEFISFTPTSDSTSNTGGSSTGGSGSSGGGGGGAVGGSTGYSPTPVVYIPKSENKGNQDDNSNKGNSNNSSSNTTNNGNQSSGGISSNLYIGRNNDDVAVLQKFLIQKGYLPNDIPIGYYGNLTKQAVQKFQCDSNIVCSGNELTTGFGQVGTQTRNAINSQLGVTQTQTSTSTAEKERIAKITALISDLLKQVAALQAQLNALKK